MLRKFLYAVVLIPNVAVAGDFVISRDRDSNVTVYLLRQGHTEVRVAPSAGCNAYSVKVDGVEYFRQPERLAVGMGGGYGNPLLYPTPNRINGARFEFEGREYKFPPNGRGNFIHGVVNSAVWQAESTKSSSEHIALTCLLPFKPGVKRFELFPFVHNLRVTITVREGRVRWTYEVENLGDRPIPFGFACHPYFLYHGARAQSFLHVPASHLMESFDELPTGKLLELADHRLDARAPRSLAGFVADHVYYGMRPEKPASLDFRQARRRVTFYASSDFTHLVVYSPQQPFLCIENQTCSTDAHNLYAKGLKEVSNLQVCEVRQKMSGFVEYRFEPY